MERFLYCMISPEALYSKEGIVALFIVLQGAFRC